MALSVSKMLTKVFGSRNERLLKRYYQIVNQINKLEPQIQEMDDTGLRARTAELKQGLIAGKLRSVDVMPEAFALIRESMDRHIGIRAIFNPDENFNPDQMDDHCLELYDSVQRQIISTGESWQHVKIPHELYAAVRKIYPESRPPFRARCFDVQIIGGLVMYEGRIAEMATGEGKTFVAPLACFMRVLEGLHCHVVTVNDYLVRRDATWVTPAFENLGLSVGFIQADMEPGGQARRRMYECDVTYGMNSEFGFDYLRDNMKTSVREQVQGKLDFAIVDEVDSILIDEARTPLIISGAAHDDAPKYRAADAVARKVIDLNKGWDQAEKVVDAARRAIKAAEGDLDRAKTKEEKDACRQRQDEAARQLAAAEAARDEQTQYYEVEMDRKSVHLTHEGIAAAQEASGVGSFYVGANMDWPHLMEQALRAHVVYERDRDYVVERGQRGDMEVVIVDEYTGRKMTGRQWSDGLHQAVEAKEKVTIKQETQTLATITLQNFFKMYKSLAGMTGTAQTEAEEFDKIYKLEVVTIPTNRPVIRDDSSDRIYRTEQEKWDSIIEEIKEISEKGRPVLVGTTSVEKSERLSNMLMRKYGIGHEVLNAKHHEREAQIILLAGQQHKDGHGQMVGNVTIATNMAGRGTDIKLARESHESGGLHVIGTERHTSRRIDNQLRGRSGRQGDPGSSRFYCSLQDDLLKLFMGEWVVNVFKKIGMEYGESIESKMLTKGILRAQKKVEERNYLQRKNLLDYDEVMDQQRTTFYGLRQKVLLGHDIEEVIWEMIGEAIADAVDKYITQDHVAAMISEWVRVNLGTPIDAADLAGMRKYEDIESFIKDKARNDASLGINTTLSEFTGEDTADQMDWDIKGLREWAKNSYHVEWTSEQIKAMDAFELREQLKTAALAQIDGRDVSPIKKYLDRLFPEKELAAWARDKFFIEIAPEEMVADEERGRAKEPQEIIELIETRARESYRRRELEYPVDYSLGLAFGGLDGTPDNPYAAEFVRNWARIKYNLDLTLEQITSQPVRLLRDQLIGLQEQYLNGGKLQEGIDAIIAGAGDDKLKLVDGFNKRFGPFLAAADLEAPAGSSQAPNAREVMIDRGRQILRRELTDLEQYVLIQIFDQSWKDHLYAMDMLKNSVGLQAFAEKDPRIQYKREGFAFFQQMMAGIRDKVTDLIFRARVEGAAPQAKSAYKVTALSHETSESYGVSEDPAAAAARAEAAKQQQASGGSSEAPQAAVKTIVRETPKVGRNDPCPCGSGKKYKKCCGVNEV